MPIYPNSLPLFSGPQGQAPGTFNNSGSSSSSSNSNNITTINFRPGLTSVQQQSITNLSNKPANQWNSQDKINWNYATNNSPIPGSSTISSIPGGFNSTQNQGLNAAYARVQAGNGNADDKKNVDYAKSKGWTPNNISTTTTSDTTKPTVTVKTQYDNVIDSNPVLKDIFNTDEKRSIFNQMEPLYQKWYMDIAQGVAKRVEAGEVVNPNIEIDLAMTQKFTDQATQELDPYFQEQVNNKQQDVNTAIERLTQDFETGVRNSEDIFKQTLANNAESEANAGLTYGSERGVRENQTVNKKQQDIDAALLSTQRDIQDKQIAGERALGSSMFSSSVPVNAYSVSNTGYTNAGSRSLYTPAGNLYGTINKDKTTAIKTRASDLESAYRAQRVLNTSQL